MITWKDFENVDIRLGTITKVEDFLEARTPAYKVWVDFGKLGTKKSSAQITKLYTKEGLVGRQVLCVTNFEPKQIGDFMSEVLLTGFVAEEGVVLAGVDRRIRNGLKLA